MLKEGVRLDRVRGGRQKYRNRMRIIGQGTINRSEGVPYNGQDRIEIGHNFQSSVKSPFVDGGDETLSVMKSLEGELCFHLFDQIHYLQYN